ncbi:MAG: hypothetical protein A2X78_03200 [Gammaproteobacteria bacterium GWE2_37_16]|nr:MAG: hypothetical protein A2X78_03200 [Gammaproteobacteria bacterium GWE2_37_16]
MITSSSPSSSSSSSSLSVVPSLSSVSSNLLPSIASLAPVLSRLTIEDLAKGNNPYIQERKNATDLHGAWMFDNIPEDAMGAEEGISSEELDIRRFEHDYKAFLADARRKPITIGAAQYNGSLLERDLLALTKKELGINGASADLQAKTLLMSYSQFLSNILVGIISGKEEIFSVGLKGKVDEDICPRYRVYRDLIDGDIHCKVEITDGFKLSLLPSEIMIENIHVRDIKVEVAGKMVGDFKSLNKSWKLSFIEIEEKNSLMRGICLGNANTVLILKISWYYNLLQKQNERLDASSDKKRLVEAILAQMQKLGFDQPAALSEVAFAPSNTTALQGCLKQLEFLEDGYELGAQQSSTPRASIPSNKSSAPPIRSINLSQEAALTASFAAIRAIRAREEALAAQIVGFYQSVSLIKSNSFLPDAPEPAIKTACLELLSFIQQNTKLDLAVRENMLKTLDNIVRVWGEFYAPKIKFYGNQHIEKLEFEAVIKVLQVYPKYAVSINGIVTNIDNCISGLNTRNASGNSGQTVQNLLKTVMESMGVLSKVSPEVAEKGLVVVNEALLQRNRDISQTAKIISTISTIGDIVPTINNTKASKTKENGFVRFLKGVAGFLSIAAGVVVKIVTLGILGSGLITKGRELMGIPQETALSKAVKGFEKEVVAAKNRAPVVIATGRTAVVVPVMQQIPSPVPAASSNASIIQAITPAPLPSASNAGGDTVKKAQERERQVRSVLGEVQVARKDVIQSFPFPVAHTDPQDGVSNSEVHKKGELKDLGGQSDAQSKSGGSFLVCSF